MPPGLDGGTYITRSDVLRGQSWDLATRDDSRSTRGGNASTCIPKQALGKREERVLHFSTCHLTGDALAPPVASDLLGHLYNRPALLEFLLGRRHASFADEAAQHRYMNQLRECGTAYDHIQSIKDVFMVHLPVRRELRGSTQQQQQEGRDASGASGSASPPVVCPITDLPCDLYPFSALRGCGHVFSARAIAQVDDHTCPSCSASFEDDDVIPLCGTSEEVERLRQRLEVARAAAKEKKKKKEKSGRKKRRRDTDDGGAEET